MTSRNQSAEQYQRAIVGAVLDWVAARAARRHVARDLAIAKRQHRKAQDLGSAAELCQLESTMHAFWREEVEAGRRLEIAITEPMRIPDHE